MGEGMAEIVNRQIVLASRPPAEPSESNFRMVESPVPEPGEGQVLVRAIYLSLDPYMRGRMRDTKSYAPPVAIDAVMTGGVVGRVAASRNPKFKEGDIVGGLLGWQDYALSDGKDLRKIDPELAPISTALGVLGMPGLTAYFALLDIGRPQAGETVLVTAASGAVGALVGQIAKIKGCRAVGLAGSPAKVAYCLEEAGYDACLNYKDYADAAALTAALEQACPDGVDVYFDNVGGWITDGAIQVMNLRGRIVVCGQISQYNLAKPELGPRWVWRFIVNRLRMEGFLVFDYADRYREGLAQLAEWLREGRLTFREDITDGLENAPRELIGLLAGTNFGKKLIRVSPPPA